jgi:hypothetical protein
MLNKGSTVLPYTPYVCKTFSVPEEVQALDGYGEGINESVYNYIDFEKKQFVKRVGKVDMGSLSWNYGSDSDVYFSYSYDLKDKIKVNYNNPVMIAENYKTVAWGSTNTNDICMNGAGVIRVYTENINIKPSGMLCYELAEPVITDISDILPDDNFIAVEGGGTVTAVNEYEYAVPSEITYQIKEATV